jgi:hypothetical protein
MRAVQRLEICSPLELLEWGLDLGNMTILCVADLYTNWIGMALEFLTGYSLKPAFGHGEGIHDPDFQMEIWRC